MAEQLERVARHLAGGVAHEGLVGLADAAVVEDEDGVAVPSRVPKVFGLSLPGVFHGAEAHDELGGRDVSV